MWTGSNTSKALSKTKLWAVGIDVDRIEHIKGMIKD
jgi:hypothetical protein